MSPEDSLHIVSNGFSHNANGSTPKKALNTSSLNGSSPLTANGSGSGHINGASVPSPAIQTPTYYGHSREEVTRILIQGLMDMGYNGAAASLSRESGYELESPSVAAFRIAILEGQWTEAEQILIGSRHSSDSRQSDTSDDGGLVLADGADRGQMLFWVRQQKFLELLEQRELSLALMVLRQELTPLNHNVHQLHALSSLLMCPAEDLRAQVRWGGTIAESRRDLLHELSKSISPSVMIRDHRLAELLDQVKRSQINSCLYHNTSITPSLYSDHLCDRENFPLRTMVELDDHAQEIWFVQFSPDGKWLATASQDGSVIIYVTSNFLVLHKLDDHKKEVTFVAWSPDSSKLISCSFDGKAKVWDVRAGTCFMTIDHHSTYPVSGAAWAPDSRSFVTSSLDKGTQLCHWKLERPPADANLHSWSGGYRAHQCAITNDGERLIVLDSDRHLYVYNFHTYDQEYRIAFSSKVTNVHLSRDSQTMMVNLSSGEVQLLEVETAHLIRRFKGQKQGQYIIRGCFGGAAENFVVSGSEGM